MKKSKSSAILLLKNKCFTLLSLYWAMLKKFTRKRKHLIIPAWHCAGARARPHYQLAWALLSGLLLALSFHTTGLLAVISLAILLKVWKNSRSPREAALSGFAMGMVYFGIGVSWLYISLHTYGHLPVIPAALCTAAFVAVLTSFIALLGYSMALLCAQKTSNWCYAFPLGWLSIEMLRAHLLTGFPWLLVGYTQIDLALRGFAPIIGVYGLSFLVALSSVLVLSMVRHTVLGCWKRMLLPLGTLLLLWGSGTLLSLVHWTHSNAGCLQVSLVQANIQQPLKWRPDFVSETLRRYQALAQEHLDSNLILFPEAAMPAYQDQIANYTQTLSKYLLHHHVALLTGILIRDPVTHQSYNAILGLGQAQGHYYKQHLVPLGEYNPLDILPWDRWWSIPMSHFKAGEPYQALIRGAGLRMAPFICYEIAYPHLIWRTLPQAQLLVVVTDDSWFGHSLAPQQHLQIARMRALETGRTLLFAANTGITAIITPQGRIQAQLPSFETQVLTGRVCPMQGRTPLIRIFHWWG